MDKRYAVTIQTTINSEALSDDRFRVRNNKMKRLIIDGSSPKKKIVSLMEEELNQMPHLEEVRIYNRNTHYEADFANMDDFLSWLKNIPIIKMCDILFTFANNCIPNIDFSIAEYNECNNQKTPKLLDLEIRGFLNDELIIEKSYSDFKRLEDYVNSLVDPSHNKFSPSNPCVNCDCRFTVNGCDITSHFIGDRDINLKYYKTDDTQVLEYLEYERIGFLTIRYVLATNEDEELACTVYSSALEAISGKVRERGNSDGEVWERELKDALPGNGLPFTIERCYLQQNVTALKDLLKQYSNDFQATSFVVIELMCENTRYRVRLLEYKLSPFGESVIAYAAYKYRDLIPPHEKWTYEDFDVIL